ncbi:MULTISPECIES: basic amino acid ABC transporter substrate-binding protein [Vitreoscilla]|uniref:Basic amino acid ABC transporter substrate-binding protein n=1 Tax=Vitreoscilla stercoraria TaxID=61 RepID=A0ABY4EAJ2_VITST|nr:MULTISPECIES: basic amino acid ABC transporter substrate-binding protein [Vitreoscilla]AUZ06210.1 ABC transporter substrate-binding protein [Vitreoscilla sp. C1]UOO92429.1 basic amino acid ABC transporter substrate-binding protein [Vitreoscilla stercoraria]
MALNQVRNLGLAFMAAAVLAACGGQSNSAAPAASKPTEAAASTPAAAGKVYKVGMNAQYPPFESMDSNGKIEGFDVDLLDAIAKEEGFQVSYHQQPWDGIFASLKTGDHDILISGITITPERQQEMLFSDPYYKITQVILVPQGKNVKSVEDLKSLDKVGVSLGTTGDHAAQKILGATSEKIIRLENLPLTLKEVESGGVDAVISDSAVVAHYVKQHGDKGFTMVEVKDFDVENYGIAVAQNNQELLDKINSGLKKIQANGEYAKISAKYFAQ